MRKYEPRNEFEVKKNIKLLQKMGLFGSETQNVVVSQATNGKTTASVEVAVPLWEIIILAVIISMIISVCCACCKNFAKKSLDKYVNTSVRRTQTLENLNNV
jgi:hypothetical protein